MAGTSMGGKKAASTRGSENLREAGRKSTGKTTGRDNLSKSGKKGSEKGGRK